KNTVKVFTLNQVQTALLEFLIGRRPDKEQIPKVGEERLKQGTQMMAHVEDTAAFLNDFTDSNPEWRRIASIDPGASGYDAYERRQKYLHFNAAGLILVGNVGHASYSRADAAERKRLTRLLAQFDRSRSNPLWQGNVMSGDKLISSLPMTAKAARMLK